MHWFAVMAVAGSVGFAKKIYARYRHGAEVAQILEDPPGVRTLARFVLDDASRKRELLQAIGNAMSPEVDGWVATTEAIRALPPGSFHEVDVVRLIDRGSALYTLELTRAWTGPHLGAPTQMLLRRIHDVLSTYPAVRALAWHCRQDRALLTGYPAPLAV